MAQLDLDTARYYVRRASGFGYLIAGLCVLLAAIAFLGDRYLPRQTGGPYVFLAVGIWNATWGYVHRRGNPSGAVLLGLMVIAGLVEVRLSSAGEWVRLLIQLGILWCYVQGFRGARAVIRFEQAEGIRRTPMSWEKRAIIGGAALVLLVLCGVGAADGAGWIPPSGIVASEELAPRQEQQLIEAGVLNEGEPLVLFYADGLWDLLESGVLVSEWGVTSFERLEDGAVAHAYLGYEEIRSVEVVSMDNDAGYAWIELESNNGQDAMLFAVDSWDMGLPVESLLEAIQERMARE